MTTVSFPIPADDKILALMKNLSNQGVDDTVISSIKNAFEHGVRQGVKNVFLYNYITKEAILDIAKFELDHEEISDELYARIYSLDEVEIISILSHEDHDWSHYQHALESQSLVDLSDIYDDAIAHALAVIIDHLQ